MGASRLTLQVSSEEPCGLGALPTSGHLPLGLLALLSRGWGSLRTPRATAASLASAAPSAPLAFPALAQVDGRMDQPLVCPPIPIPLSFKKKIRSNKYKFRMYTSLGTESSLWDTYISISIVKKKKKGNVLRCTFLVAVFVALFVAYADKHGFPWCSVSFYICINLYIIYTYIYTSQCIML